MRNGCDAQERRSNWVISQSVQGKIFDPLRESEDEEGDEEQNVLKK